MLKKKKKGFILKKRFASYVTKTTVILCSLYTHYYVTHIYTLYKNAFLMFCYDKFLLPTPFLPPRATVHTASAGKKMEQKLDVTVGATNSNSANSAHL